MQNMRSDRARAWLVEERRKDARKRFGYFRVV